MIFENVSSYQLLDNLRPQGTQLVLIDPPYGRTQLPWDQAPDWKKLWSYIQRILHPHGTALIFAGLRDALPTISANADEYRYELIMPKRSPTDPLNSGWKPLNAHELVLVFQRNPKSAVYNPQMGYSEIRRGTVQRRTSGRHWAPTTQGSTWIDDGSRLPTTLLPYPEHRPDPKLHPTQKAINILRYLIRQYSHPGGLVVDCYAGSGSTGVAALLEGRQFAGAELNEQYFLTARRWLQSVDDQPILLPA